MKVKIPTTFKIDYPEENFKYYNQTKKSVIAKKLYDSCSGYCMYCGKKVSIDGDYIYQIEHSVDKDGNRHQECDPHEVLKHCKFNMAISCSACNMTCKKAIDKINLKVFSPIEKCPSKCKEICKKYSLIREEYMKRNEIILQPLGKDKPVEYNISYNLLKQFYFPDCAKECDEAVVFVQNHIDRFRINDERFSPCVTDMCGKIILLHESGVDDIARIFEILECDTYENYLGILYLGFLIENFSGKKTVKELVDFCKLQIILDAVD